MAPETSLPPSLSTTVLLTPCRNGLRAGQDNTVDVLLRIQAPDLPPGDTGARPPQALALVIDRSGSMSGRPLAQARRCAEFVVGRLRGDDAVALVQFDDRVQRLWPPAPLGDGQALRAAIAGIEAGGSTNLHGGWREGAEALVDRAGIGLRRVILLSDGQANVGCTDPAAITTECAAFAAMGITTSTYGLGRHFNEELMLAMARAGGGNAYYGDTAEDLHEPFEQELALLANLCLHELHLQLDLPPGVQATMLNPLPRQAQKGWRLPDLAWGSEAWAMLRLQLPASAVPRAGTVLPLLRVSIEGRGPDGQALRLERAGLALPVLAPDAWDALAEDELVTRRLAELSAAEALTDVRRAAQDGDWTAVRRRLAEASRRYAGNPWVAGMLDAMRQIADSGEHERMRKELLYSSERLGVRLAAKDEALRAWSPEDGAGPAYLRRKPAQGKT